MAASYEFQYVTAATLADIDAMNALGADGWHVAMPALPMVADWPLGKRALLQRETDNRTMPNNLKVEVITPV